MAKNGKNGKRAESHEWHCLLRLPTPLAKRLKKAAEKNQVSINSAVMQMIDIWVKSERV